MANQRQILNAFNNSYERQIRIAERQTYRKAYKVYIDSFKEATEQVINGALPETVNILDAVQFRNLFIDIYTDQGMRFAKWWQKLFMSIATKNDNPDLTIWQMALAQYGEERAGKMVATVQDSLFEQFVSQMKKMYQDPEFQELGAEAQARELRKQSFWAKKARFMALRVARTESNAAANLGIEQSSLSMFNANEMEKRWITARDEKVRDTHRQAEAQGAIPFESSFSVGGTQMKRPGDPAGGASEVINCRCRIITLPKADTLDNLFDELTKPSQSATASGVSQSVNEGFISSSLISALFG